MFSMNLLNFTIGEWRTDKSSVVAAFLSQSINISHSIVAPVHFRIMPARPCQDLTGKRRYSRPFPSGLSLLGGLLETTFGRLLKRSSASVTVT
jgi:hypothetical protein